MATNHEIPRLRVNARRHLRILSFTLVALSALAAGPARAERVLVLRPTGDAPEAQRTVVEQSIRSALEQLSYEAVLEESGASEAAAPEDANDFRALAELARCQYAIAPAVVFEPGGYRLTLRVGYAPRTRLDSLVVEVRAIRENDRLVEVLRAVLDPDGIGDAATRFGGPDAEARALEGQQSEAEARRQAEEAAQQRAAEEAAAAEQAERERQEAEDQARREEEERQREALEGREADRLEQEARDAWAARERYGRPERRLVLGGIGVMGILNATPGAGGGAVAELEGRFGYALDVPGLELRAGLDINFGATGGFALTGGAVYMASPWQNAKVHVGGGLELGYYQAVTGNQVPQFLVRAEALVAWHATRGLWLEAAVPTFTILSANGGVLTLGAAVRAGTRF